MDKTERPKILHFCRPESNLQGFKKVLFINQKSIVIPVVERLVQLMVQPHNPPLSQIHKILNTSQKNFHSYCFSIII